MEFERCVWCGLKTKIIDGPVHPYLESSAGCWAKYGELLAREYENYEYMQVHSLTVDAYALQHPGRESRQTIQSVNIHLASLYSYFVLGYPLGQLANIKSKFSEQKKLYEWLDPPKTLTRINVSDVLEANNASQHRKKVLNWSEYVFGEWEDYHSKIASYFDMLGIENTT